MLKQKKGDFVVLSKISRFLVIQNSAKWIGFGLVWLGIINVLFAVFFSPQNPWLKFGSITASVIILIAFFFRPVAFISGSAKLDFFCFQLVAINIDETKKRLDLLKTLQISLARYRRLHRQNLELNAANFVKNSTVERVEKLIALVDKSSVALCDQINAKKGKSGAVDD